MTRIGVGGLINLDRVHQAELLLNDIRLFHQHAASAAAAAAVDSSSYRQTSNGADSHSQELTPDTAATEQLVATDALFYTKQVPDVTQHDLISPIDAARW